MSVNPCMFRARKTGMKKRFREDQTIRILKERKSEMPLKNLRLMHIARRTFVVLTISLVAAPISCASPSSKEKIDINSFIGGAFLKYETDFLLSTTPERFGRMLDDLFLMGALWQAYDFSPRYSIVRTGTAWHITDPSGLEGVLHTVETLPRQRTFIAKGKLKNWFVHMTLTGRALFFLDYDESPGGIQVRLTVYGEGSASRVEQAMLKTISPILRHYIGRRVERNLHDLSTIVTDLEKNPAEINRKLNGLLTADLNRILEPSVSPSQNP